MFPFPKNKIRMSMRVKNGVDRLGNDVFEYVSEDIAGVLLVPANTDDLSFPQEQIDMVLVDLHLPKTFTKSISGAKFEALDGPFIGRVFKVHGDPLPFAYSPLPWNRRVRAEEVRGGK